MQLAELYKVVVLIVVFDMFFVVWPVYTHSIGLADFDQAHHISKSFEQMVRVMGVP